MEGYPKLWYDFAPDTSDGRARDDDGVVKDPHGTGARGYVINNCRNITFQDLLLLRSAEWTVHVIRQRAFHHQEHQDREPQAAAPRRCL